MAIRGLTLRASLWLLLAAVVVFSVALARAESSGSAPHRFRVSQKDQAFHPNELHIRRGDVVDIVNDDGDLLHHAYIDSPTLKFDSGDQEPGMTAEIAFPVKGSFKVLCGIHPRMKLTVYVE